MTKLVPFVAALGVAFANPAFADTPLKFTRDGITYVGSISERDGVRYITGEELGSHRAFQLRVVNGWVTGQYGGDEIAYPEPVRLVATR